MIGIFGGTFDPIHYGHLRPLLEVREHLGLEEVRLIPLRQAVHREQPETPAEIRYAMVQAAVGGVGGVRVDDLELRRAGPSWSVLTLEALRAELGSEVPLALILGGDAFNGFHTWHRPADILDLAHLVVMERPGHRMRPSAELDALIKGRHVEDPGKLRDAPGGLIYSLAVTQLEISATEVRRRLAQGQDVRYLLPDAVLAIIKALGLYR